MPDQIYLVDPQTRMPVAVNPTSFAAMGLRERADLQEWVINHPTLLGEELLFITSEFDRFDASALRLDILALDRDGNLVIVELKLDASRSLADLQALRYAAFCSTMTMDDVVRHMAVAQGLSSEEADERIKSFLGIDVSPELNDRPRIILGAGAINDQELTSTVLWLRTFGVDIKCVELTPYQVPGRNEIVLVPRTIIPLPEVQRYMVGVERKAVAKARQATEGAGYAALWQAIATEFESRAIDLVVSRARKSTYLHVRAGHPDIHYEWIVRKSEGFLDVCIHFESPHREMNLRRMAPIKEMASEIARTINLPLDAEPWGRNWAQVRLRIPYTEGDILPTTVKYAVDVMVELIELTLPTLRQQSFAVGGP
jgi:hypothetical protein